MRSDKWDTMVSLGMAQESCFVAEFFSQKLVPGVSSFSLQILLSRCISY